MPSATVGAGGTGNLAATMLGSPGDDELRSVVPKLRNKILRSRSFKLASPVAQQIDDALSESHKRSQTFSIRMSGKCQRGP